MSSRKRGYLRRSTERASKSMAEGQIGWTAGLFFILFLGATLCAVLQLERYRTASLYLEDALAASNLASAVIDVREYGISHKILIDDPQRAYERYRWAVQGNLNLDVSWEGQAGGLVQGPVSIVCYMVYNVEAGGVTVYHFDGEGRMTQWREAPGSVVSPNGIAVENTSVYSEIAFDIKNMFGITVKAHKANLADIAR